MTINLKYSTSTNLNWTRENLIQILTNNKRPLIKDPLILNAFLKVDRKDFVPETLKYLAYNDISLDIGNDVQLSKPTTIAEMLTCLKPKFGGKYLVLGTGTGYVSLLLSVIAGEMGRVYSVENVNWIHALAKNNIAKYPQIRNLEIIFRDTTKGFIEKSPYDGIYITYPVDEVFEEIKRQLRISGGRLVVTTKDFNLRVIERKQQDEYEEEIVDLVSM